MSEFNFKDRYVFDDLVDIVRLLRAPDGCPWDKEQTHESIRKNFLEETYEVCEAIDTKNTELLKEELGDVLLQVVLHSQMENEIGSFNIDDVADGICKKLIVRHPHIFSDTVAETSEKVLDNWDKIKMQTKKQKTYSQAMNEVCKALPALMRSEKIQKKANKAGFDWDSVDGALDKLNEEINELRVAIAQGDDKGAYEELGDLLFSAVNVSRFIKVDAENSLNFACDKFIERFAHVEELATERGKNIDDLNMSELDSLWDEVKIKYRGNR